MKNNFESMENMHRMQQEAVRRVKEMQKRAKQSLDAEQNYRAKKETPPEPSIVEQNNTLNLLENTSTNKSIKHKSNMDFFSVLLNDNEKTLILLLILLLIDENSDLSIVIALIYLIT